jgi:hypothetical protein
MKKRLVSNLFEFRSLSPNLSLLNFVDKPTFEINVKKNHPWSQSYDLGSQRQRCKNIHTTQISSIARFSTKNHPPYFIKPLA